MNKYFDTIYERSEKDTVPTDDPRNIQKHFSSGKMKLDIRSNIRAGVLHCTPLGIDMKLCRDWAKYLTPMDRRDQLSFELAKEKMFLKHFLDNIKLKDSRPYMHFYPMVKNYIKYTSLMKVRSLCHQIDKGLKNLRYKTIVIARHRDCLFNLARELDNYKRKPVFIYNKMSYKTKKHRLESFAKREDRNVLVMPHCTMLNSDYLLDKVDRIYFLDLSFDLQENVAVINKCFNQVNDDISIRYCVIHKASLENKLYSALFTQLLAYYKNIGVQIKRRSTYHV